MFVNIAALKLLVNSPVRALIHIGPPKSGTTSIQTYLSQNQNLFAANNIMTLIHNSWVRTIAAAFRDKAPDTYWARSNNLSSEQNFTEFKRDALERLVSEISSGIKSTRLLVISSEGLSGYQPSEIENLKTFLDKYCEKVEIICYLRRQDLLAASKHKNKIRNSNSIKSIVGTYDKYGRSMDYWMLLSRWSAILGKENIIVRTFPDSAITKFDLIDDFHLEMSKRAGEISGEFKRPENRNTGWSWQASEFVRLANKSCKDQLSDPEFHHRFVRLVDSIFTGGIKQTIDRKSAKSIVSIYEEGNDKVRSEFLSEGQALFHDDYSRYSDSAIENVQQLSIEDAIQVGVELLKKLSEDNSGEHEWRMLGWGRLKKINHHSLYRAFKRKWHQMTNKLF